MKNFRRTTNPLFATALLAATLAMSPSARAHCDTLDGPVVKDAETALAKKDVTPVLKWIRPEDEESVKEAFKKTIAVRKKGTEAKQMADSYFFETLVRLHRASESEPFTGLKPAGSQEPVYTEADRALESGSVDFLTGHLTAEIETGIRRRFQEAAELRAHKDESVDAGRAYVKAYVEYLHYVERLAADLSAHAHDVEPPGSDGFESHEKIKQQEGE